MDDKLLIGSWNLDKIKQYLSYLLVGTGLLLMVIYGNKAIAQVDDRRAVEGTRERFNLPKESALRGLDSQELEPGFAKVVSSTSLQPRVDDKELDDTKTATDQKSNNNQIKISQASELLPDSQKRTLENEKHQEIPRVYQPKIK